MIAKYNRPVTASSHRLPLATLVVKPLWLALSFICLLACSESTSKSPAQESSARPGAMPPGAMTPSPAMGVAAVDGQCTEGLALCDGACFDLQTTAAHCGGCNTPCGPGAECSGGACACAGGGFDCGGTCVDLQSSGQHCGTCNQACGATQSCNAGECGCMAPYGACGSECVDVQNDVQNCGECNAACGNGSACTAGECTCQDGLDSCPHGCANLQEDGAHCGACGSACAAGEVCSQGVCAAGCAGALLQCGASCVDAATSVLHCGTCDNSCAPGQSCNGGLCTCADGQIACGTLCVDTQTSLSHCGRCGNPCGGGASCSAGSCVCADASQTVCGGQCVSIMDDAQNCGACGNLCRSGVCEGGQCPPVKQCAAKAILTEPVLTNFESYDGATAVAGWPFVIDGDPGSPSAVWAGVYSYAEATDMTHMLTMGTGNNSKYAIRVTSDGAIEWGGGVGLWMNCIDVSAYGGISFWVRGNTPDGTAFMALSMESTNPPDENEPLSGGTCADECAGPGASIPVTEVWTRVFLSWADFEPGTADGASIPATGDGIAGIQWNISIAFDDETGAAINSPYELEIDDIQFFSANIDCAAGEEVCSNSCVDTSSNSANCGTCGSQCAADAACTAGSCVCPGGLTQCVQECVDTQSDKAHCGACGNVCALTQECTNGQCTGGDSKTSSRCGSPMTLLGNPFGCDFAWGVNDEGNLPGYVDFFSKWVGYETGGGCDGCSFLGDLASEDVVPMYIAYFIAYLGKSMGYDDCNLDNDGNLCTHGAQVIRDNRDKIISTYENYARRSYAAYPNKPVIWLIEPDFSQYVEPTQMNPLSMGELGQLATDIVCAIKSNMPNAVIALTHSSWMEEPAYSSYWSNLPLDLADMVHVTGSANAGDYLNATDAANRADGTWSYLGSLTGKPIIADTSFGITEMSDSWSTSSAAVMSGHISSGVAAVLVGAPPGNYESNISTLRPSLGSTCQ